MSDPKRIRPTSRDKDRPQACGAGVAWHLIPIGQVHTPFGPLEEIPKHFESIGRATVEVFPQYSEGLDGLGGFSHAWLLTYLHMSQGYALTLAPKHHDAPRGLFTTRSPSRPNPIGLTLVRLTGRKGGLLFVEGADLADGTPLLDIKPYLGRNDAPGGEVRGI